jgi:hypothetical protein
MKIISHRGNLNGPDISTENRPDQILKALNHKFDCEVDLWVDNGKFFLGHDNPCYEIERDFLKKDGLWIHAKNFNAINFLAETNLHWFWHEHDKMTLTSRGERWCYPGFYCTNGITVLEDMVFPEKLDKLLCKGFCTDYPMKYKK